MKKVITGTGRCGTSFIMQLLTNIGENTGYTPKEAEKSIDKIDGLNGGIEHDAAWPITRRSTWIKNPLWIDIHGFKHLQTVYRIEKVYIPIRDLTATAKSREYQNENAHGGYGGFWDASDVDEQKSTNAKKLYHFLYYLESNGIEYTLISFDVMMKNPRYLKAKLDLDTSISKFIEEYENLIDLNKIRF